MKSKIVNILKNGKEKKWLLFPSLFSIVYPLGVLTTIFPFYLEGIKQRNTAFVAFMLLQLLLLITYVFYATYLQKQEENVIDAHRFIILLSIGITTFSAACIYIFTSPGLSNDINLYATYGRILWVYHANPYFIPPLTFPHDPLFSFTDWKNVVAIYGPIWMLVCALLTPFAGTNPIQILIAFRVFASIIHFMNAFLIYTILKTQGYSLRTILIGTFLYALNPLVLFESSAGGHNDILMTMFVLLGILYAVRVEKKRDFHFVQYIPSLIMFTLAVLVKITIAPILVIFILMLSFKSASSTLERWRLALLNMSFASIICAGMLILFYGPFWFGHSFKSIMYIFSSQPESVGSFTSLLSALQIWDTFYPLPTVLAPITNLHLWNIMIYGTMAIVLLLGSVRLFYNPTIQNVVFVTIGVMAVFLLMTNWFLAWYIICPLAMAILCLPIVGRYKGYIGRLGRGLLAFTFTFSFSAFFTYYFNFAGSYGLHAHPQRIDWLIVCYIVTFTLPTLAFLIFYYRNPHRKSLFNEVQ